MNEVLQTQQHALLLEVAVAARVSSPTCPGYNNGLMVYNHPTVHPPELLVFKNMENVAMNPIKHILDRVRSL